MPDLFHQSHMPDSSAQASAIPLNHSTTYRTPSAYSTIQGIPLRSNAVSSVTVIEMTKVTSYRCSAPELHFTFAPWCVREEFITSRWAGQSGIVGFDETSIQVHCISTRFCKDCYHIEMTLLESLSQYVMCKNPL